METYLLISMFYFFCGCSLLVVQSLMQTRFIVAICLGMACSFLGLVRGVLKCGIECITMGLDNAISSPHRRTQGPFSSPSKKFAQSDISCSALVKRHSFLLTALVLLAVLCTVYLYFAVTLGSDEACSVLLGIERESCRLNHAKTTLTHGKLKLF